MKKKRVFAVISAMVMSVSMLFTTGISAKAEESGTATLTVSEIGYEEIVGMYDDTIVAKKNGKYGMAKLDGTEIVPFEYENCRHFDKNTGVCMFYNLQIEYVSEYDGHKDSDYNYNNYYLYNHSGKLLYQFEDYAWKVSITTNNEGIVFLSGIMSSNPEGSFGEAMNFKCIWIDSNTGEIVNRLNYGDVDGYCDLSCFTVNNGKVIMRIDGDNGWISYLYDGVKKTELALNEEYGNPFFINGDYIIQCQYNYLGEYRGYPRDITTYVYQISTGKYYKLDSYHVESKEDDKGKWFNVVGNNIMISNLGGSLRALYDINGNAITEEKYTSIEGTAEIKNYYLVGDGEKWFYIDSKGKEYGTDLKDAGSFYGGHAIVLNNDGEAYIIDESFNKVSESVKAESVTSYNDNLYAITVDGLRYPVVMNKAADTGTGVYEVNVTADNAISAADFTTLLTENQTKDVVFKTADGITFTFAKGTMKAVDGKDSYDFSAVINKDYDTVTGLPAHVTKGNFISLIDYKYSGQLPAEASIRIPVGKDYAGKTLYYSQLLNDSSISLVSSVVVDAEGYVTVKQSHCSSYILTSTEPVAELTTPAEADGNGQNTSPQTGDITPVFMWFMLAVVAMGAVVVTYKKVRRA